MRRFLESDTGFYVAVGAFTILTFVVALAILVPTSPDAVDPSQLLGFVAGFLLFMTSYFVAMAIYRLVPE